MNYHTKSIDETFKLLEATEKGLSTKEAQKREKHFGKNSLPKEKEKTLIRIFLEQFKSPIIYILLIASIVSVMIKEYSDAAFIMAVLFINAIIGTYQEYTARKKADSLKSSVKTYVDLLRDGIKKEFSALMLL
ncbi:cation-transporting P-type ATPase [Halarcobacter anaerophilus]|uniref:cation-transporting P-type ATPase n=1 Tax=Halarcobacter anaerophilus TaxID=877500 RepID=UPI000A70E092|nr:cation-transporting P-type ATPase [Halarcobacter anaerophilus]